VSGWDAGFEPGNGGFKVLAFGAGINSMAPRDVENPGRHVMDFAPRWKTGGDPIGTRGRLRIAMSLLSIGAAVATITVMLMPTGTPFPQALFSRQLEGDSAAPAGAFVLLGDSVFELFDTTRLRDRVLNFGIGGDTSSGLLSRIGRYRSLAKARAIALEIGINDLRFRSGQDVVANYRRILAALPKEPRIYLLGILPIDEAAFLATYGGRVLNAEIAQINAAASELCRRRGNCVLLRPFGAPLAAEYHIGDGVHLNQAGYSLLAAALASAEAEP